jgi:MarR family 2-MHQ and catechol resistance regulon transcriptional repressor
LPQKRRESTTVVNASRLQADARDLHEALSELVQAYQFRDRITVCYHDISVTQCYALSSVIRQGPMTLNSLAAELYLDKSTASRVVDALVQKGYVRRLPDPGDARALSLEATGKGLDLHARIIEELIEEMKNLIADSSPAKRRATIQLVGRLARAASKKFKRKARRCGREA